MRSSLFFLFLLNLLLALPSAALNGFPVPQKNGPFKWQPGTPLPGIEPNRKAFWKLKPKAYKRISEGRAVLVSVTDKKNKAGKKQLTMVGGAIYNVPAIYAFNEVRKYSSLSQMSSFIQRTYFDRAAQQMFFHCKAFKYQARLVMQVEERVVSKSGPYQIRFRVISGGFRGLSGVIEFIALRAQRSEVSLTLEYNYVKLPLPQFFVEFGLEMVLQKMAGRIRSYLEEHHHG